MTELRKLKTNDGFTIAAAHTYGKSNRVALWLHGITVNKDEYLGLFKDGAEYLASKGIDSLRIDFRGHGSSSGSSIDFGIVSQIFDVEAALEFLNDKYEMDKARLHIIGCSFGAPPAIFTALKNPSIVKGLTLIAPVLSYVRTFLRPETDWGKSIFNKDTVRLAQKKKRLYFNDKFPVSLRFIEEMRLIQPDIALAQVTCKVVIIHGDADSMVPYAVSKEVSFRIPEIQLVTMHNMDHGFMDVNDEEGTGSTSQENKRNIYERIANQWL